MTTLSIYEKFTNTIFNLPRTEDFSASFVELNIPESLQDDPSVQLIYQELSKLEEKSKLNDIQILEKNKKTYEELSLIIDSLNKEIVYIFSIDANVFDLESSFNSLNIPLIAGINTEDTEHKQFLIFENPELFLQQFQKLHKNLKISYSEIELKIVLKKLLEHFYFSFFN